MLSRLHHPLDRKQKNKWHYKASKKSALFLIYLSSLCTLPPLLWAEDTDEASAQAETDASSKAATENDTLVDSAPDLDNEKIAPIKNTQRHQLNIPQKRTQSLIHHLELMERKDEVVQLSADEEDFYGLYLPEETGLPQGAVLVLHDNQQHGHWPELIAPIRESLPQYGWTTFSIELPERPASKRILRAPPEKTLTTNSKGEDVEENSTVTLAPITTNQAGEALLTEEAADSDAPDFSNQPQEQEQEKNSLEPSLPRLAKLPDLPTESQLPVITSEVPAEDPFEQYKTLNRQRIIAAVDYLKSKGQFNLVLLGYGTGAAWAIDYVAQINQTAGAKGKKRKGDIKGLTLVTIDARPSISGFTDMNQQLIKMNIPYLDIIQPNKTLELKNGKPREAIMKRNQNPNYQQIISAYINNKHDENSPIIRRIRGWIKIKAGGTLVKMAR